MKTGLNTWLTQAQFRRTLDNGGFEKVKTRIIERFDAISKRYEGAYCDARSRDCLMQGLYSLYACEIRPILGDELGKKAFREALVQYCGFAYGVSLCEELFSTKNLKI